MPRRSRFHLLLLHSYDDHNHPQLPDRLRVLSPVSLADARGGRTVREGDQPGWRADFVCRSWVAKTGILDGGTQAAHQRGHDRRRRGVRFSRRHQTAGTSLDDEDRDGVVVSLDDRAPTPVEAVSEAQSAVRGFVCGAVAWIKELLVGRRVKLGVWMHAVHRLNRTLLNSTSRSCIAVLNHHPGNRHEH